MEDQALSSAEEAVKSQLKDSSSAIFEDVRLVYGAPITNETRWMYTCGYVNSRNSFGAMAGRTRFVVYQSATTLNGKRYFSTDLAYVEDPVEEEARVGTPASFDSQHWKNCDGPVIKTA